MLTNERKRIGKGGHGFGIPGSLTNGKGVPISQLMSKNGHQRKQAQQGRSRTQNRQVRPLALRLHPKMGADLMKRDFHIPVAATNQCTTWTASVS